MKTVEQRIHGGTSHLVNGRMAKPQFLDKQNKTPMEINKTRQMDEAGCGVPEKKRKPYVAPAIEVTTVVHTENLLTGSTRLRPATQVMVEDWDDEGINNEDIVLP